MLYLPLWAYLGPDTIVPLTSALAAIGGAVLILWRYIYFGTTRLLRFVLGKSPSSFEDVSN